MTMPSARFLSSAGNAVLAACCLIAPPAFGQVLFDATKAETAGNADWVINGSSQRILSPAVSGVTSGTAETYWTGALSSWGVALAKLRNSGQISLAGNGIETLPAGAAITYGNGSNPQDLSNYQIYVVCEPNIRFTDTEKTAILNFVNNGGGLFMVADHAGSDRNNDGWDSLQIWNDLMYTNSVQSNPFGFAYNSDDVSPNATTDSSPSNPLTHGLGGTVTTFQYNNGSTMAINNAGTTHAAAWTPTDSTKLMALYGTYGAGRFVAIGDSSPMDDGTGEAGHTLFNGWSSPVDDGFLAINGTVWLLGAGNTNPIPPSVITGTASAVGASTATLNGTVNPNGQSTMAQFDYGVTTNYGSSAVVSGTFTGTTAQALSANLTGMTPATTYHFRLAATNASGLARGLDQTFTTAASNSIDLTITKTHNGNFTQGDPGDSYTIIVTNAGTLATTGTITVTDVLPAGLTATAISGSGWTPNLGTLSCTRSDTLGAGAAYPPITVTVNVASNAPVSVTNTASVSGGGDANPANNSVTDVTAINASGGAGGATNVVISQFYGAGGNASGVTFKNDFVELFNPLSTTVNLSAWSVQYASASGTSWQVANLNGSVQPYHYYLVQLASGGANGASLPTADATGTINISAASGKLALVSNQTALSGANPVGTATIVDFAGFGTANGFEGAGAAPGGGNTTSTLRKNGGYTDSNNNAADFTTASPPAPRNSASPSNPPAVTSVADLAIFMTHSGAFTQADIGDAYTITITNSGAAVTVGTVNVTNTLPAGLIATAIGGTGWTANLGTLSCTRSDALAVGGGYPPITVTVNVATNASSSVTNLAAVSGGGQTNTLNDTAKDPTSITALTPIQLWRLQWFGTTANSGAAADNAITTSDGMPNLLKYALGLNPLVATTNPVVGDITTGYLRLTLPKNPNATDISFHVEVSPDLVPASWTGSGTTIDQNTSTLLQVHVNVPVSSSDRNFIRLRVSRP